MMRTKHRELYRKLKEDILSGKYAQDQSFPSEAQLMAANDCSRTTVRKALEELRHEGLLGCRQGKGSFVTKRAAERTFGLILSGTSRFEYFQPIAMELARIAQANRCALLFVNVDATDPAKLRHDVREIAADFIKRRVSGVIYHPIEFPTADDTSNSEIVSVFRRAKIPVVLLDSDIVPPPAESGCDVVSIDNVHAAERLAGHLLDQGARRVGVVMLPAFFPNMMDRVRGVATAMIQRGKAWSMRDVLAAVPSNVKAVRAFLRGKSAPDAFVCQNDAIAADFARTLAKLGHAVPRDILLAGFDGMDVSRVMTPPLTTIRQPHAEIARTVFELLLKRCWCSKGTPSKILLPSELIIRASSQRPPHPPRNPSRMITH